jgi:hypothetical protein
LGPLYKTIEKFERKNFMLWKFKIKTLFKVKELWGLVTRKEVKPNSTNVARFHIYTRKERRAFNLLVKNLFNN